MIPTPRLLMLALVGAFPIAAGKLVPAFYWVALVYLLALCGLVLFDRYITPKPKSFLLSRINDTKLSLGAQNRIAVAIHNGSERPLQVEVRDEFPPDLPTSDLTLRARLEPGATEELVYHVRPLRRGDYRFGAINVRYLSTLGTFKQQFRDPSTEELIKVYPNVLDIRKYDMLARKGMLEELGLHSARIYGVGTEFERLRDYTPDDEFKRINWKATARRNKPIAVEFETERSQSVVSMIDTGRLMRPPVGDIAKVDYAINAALLLSYVAMLKGDHIGLLTFADHVGNYLPPRRGKVQFHHMLELLYNVPTQPIEPNYARALSYLTVKNKRRSLVILFTDLSTLDTARPLIAHLARLAQRHLPLCVVMSDPNVTALAGLRPETSTQTYERAVAEQLLDERRLVLDTLTRAGVHTIDVPADKLTIAVINKYLELKGRGLL